MAITSSMLPLGTCAPLFALHDVVGGQIYSLDSFATRPPCWSCSSAVIAPM